MVGRILHAAVAGAEAVGIVVCQCRVVECFVFIMSSCAKQVSDPAGTPALLVT